MNRVILTQMIVDHYKRKSQIDKDTDPDEYLNWLTNDLVGFMGYRNTLEKENKEGLELWDEIVKETSRNKKSDMEQIRKFLHLFTFQTPIFI